MALQQVPTDRLKKCVLFLNDMKTEEDLTSNTINMVDLIVSSLQEEIEYREEEMQRWKFGNERGEEYIHRQIPLENCKEWPPRYTPEQIVKMVKADISIEHIIYLRKISLI